MEIGQTISTIVQRPIMAQVGVLSEYIYQKVELLPKRMQHTYGQKLMDKLVILFMYAKRETMQGGHMTKIHSVLEEINALSGMIYFLKGWPLKTAAFIDVKCVEISKMHVES